MLTMGAVAGSRGLPSLISTVALTRAVFNTGPGPDTGGEKPGPSEFDHRRESSGTGAALCFAALGAPTAGTAPCPKAGTAAAAANDANKRKFPRRLSMRLSLHGSRPHKLRRRDFLVHAPLAPPSAGSADRRRSRPEVTGVGGASGLVLRWTPASKAAHMDEFNELNLTDAVIERLRATPDPRLQEVMMSAVRHLHDFVRDVRPTFDEWSAAIRFLTRVGQISDETRQEFILLSDIFGVSMLVDAINHPPSSEVTDTTVLGPFYGEPPPECAQGTDIANGAAGEPLRVDVEIKSADGKRLPNALVDVWQSDS